MLYYGSDYYPEQWPEARWETDARLMHEAGMNVARIGEFAWASLEPQEGRYEWGWLDRVIETLSAHGIQVVLGTPTAAPPPWLSTAHPEILPRDRHRCVRHPGSRRHYCPNSPVYAGYTRRIVAALAERYGHDARVIGWQIDNEFGCHDTHVCYCDTCARRFRAWLKVRYGSLEALNRAWGSVFWSALYTNWDQVPLPWATLSYHNPSQMMDFYRFGTDSMALYQQVQIDILRELAANQFVTHNFMPFHSRELDFVKIAAPLDLVSWDNYHFYGATPALVAATHDLYWGMKRRNTWIMEQQVGNVNWTPYNPTLRPGEAVLKVWQGIAHGVDGIVYFRWRAAQLGAELYHSGLLDHSGQPTRGYAEAQGVGQQLPGLAPLLKDSSPRAEIAFLHDYEARWSLDLQPHNQDLASDKTFQRALMGPYEALWQRNIAAHILPADDSGDLSAYKVVILPAINLVSQGLAERFESYVRSGGILIATARTGFKDEFGQVPGTPPGHLADLMGVTIEEIDSQPKGHSQQIAFVDGPVGSVPVSHWFEVLAPQGIQPLAIYQKDYYVGRAAATLREIGQGRCLYVGVLADAEFYGRLFDWLLPQLGVERLLHTPDGVEVRARTGPAGRVIFVLNHNDETVSVSVPAGCFDALTGKAVKGPLALGAREVRILLAQQ